MTFSGTLVVSGRAVGVVVGTGAQTELGRINQMLAAVNPLETPLLRQIKQFGHTIAKVIGFVSVLVFAYAAVLRRRSPSTRDLRSPRTRAMTQQSGGEFASANPRRERKAQGFESVGSAQKFLSLHAAAYNTFNVRCHLVSARTHRAFRASAMHTWRAAVAAA